MDNFVTVIVSFSNVFEKIFVFCPHMDFMDLPVFLTLCVCDTGIRVIVTSPKAFDTLVLLNNWHTSSWSITPMGGGGTLRHATCDRR